MVVYGDGHNGKTTYFRFLGHLLTGRVIEPVSGKNMAKSDWEGLLQLARHMQTCMPIFVDDIKERALKGKTANLEHQIKTHWENDWMPDRNYPLMMLNTNYDGMEEWAKSRVTRLDFHVKFNDDQRSHRVLQEILSRPNDVFGAFAAQTTSLPEGSLDTGMDELAWARSVLKELYALAERDLPTFFPHVPPSEVFDMDALYCSSRIKYGLARLKRKRRAWMLIFQSRQSMFAFKARLPHTVSSSVDDKTLLIEPQSVPAMKRFLKAAKSSSR